MHFPPSLAEEGDERRATIFTLMKPAATPSKPPAHMTQCDDDDDARSFEVLRPQSGEHQNRRDAGSLTRTESCTKHKYS